MSRRVLFTFWEPEHAMPAYVRLCMETWKKNLVACETRILNYSNLFDYVEQDSLDWALLRRLPLPIQKDAIQVAVLRRHGGVFLDADTLILARISHLIDLLQRVDFLMIGDHVAFTAAKRNARCLEIWLDEIRKKLKDLRSSRIWDLLDKVAPRKSNVVDRAFRTAIRTRVKWYYLANSILPKLRKECSTTELCQLDRDDHAFILETMYFADLRDKSPQWKYHNFWFSETLSDNTALDLCQNLVALHNSWTPTWYKRLSSREVLDHKCLLSRTLKQLLDA